MAPIVSEPTTISVVRSAWRLGPLISTRVELMSARAGVHRADEHNFAGKVRVMLAWAISSTSLVHDTPRSSVGRAAPPDCRRFQQSLAIHPKMTRNESGVHPSCIHKEHRWRLSACSPTCRGTCATVSASFGKARLYCDHGPDPGARHRSEHRDVQRRGFPAAPPTSV